MSIKTSIKAAMLREKLYCPNLLLTSVFRSLGDKLFFLLNAIASDIITGIISIKGTCHMSHIKTNL